MARRPQRQRRTVRWSAVTSFVTAAAAVGALIFTSDSLDATRDQIAVALQGQYADRYSRATEQLGAQGPDQLHVRLGAIYELESLANDSPGQQPKVINVLAAFIRISVPHVPEISPSPYCVDDSDPVPPRPDIQAALTVLGRRNIIHDRDAVVDLSATCLRGMKIPDANFSGANLGWADLAGSILTDADFGGATLYYTNLSFVTFGGADFAAAGLLEANLVWSVGAGVNFANADLAQTDLTGARFDDANFRGADLHLSVLNEARLPRANLTDADLTAAQLNHTDLALADVRNAEHDENTVVVNVLDRDVKGRWW